MNTDNEINVDPRVSSPAVSSTGGDDTPNQERSADEPAAAASESRTEASSAAPADAADGSAPAPAGDRAPTDDATKDAEATDAATTSASHGASVDAATAVPADVEPGAPTDAGPADAVPADGDPSSASESAEASAEGGDDKGLDLKVGKPELPAEGEMSFAEMFELAEKQSQEKRRKLKAAIGSDLRPGQVIFAKVVSISHDSVFVDIGAKAEGVIPKSELEEDGQPLALAEGDKVEARIRKIEGGTVQLGRVPAHLSLRKREELKEAHRTRIPVDGVVQGTNKGGFDVEIAGVRAFCPASQIDVRPGKAERYTDQKFPFLIVEFKDGGRNIVVSRRQLLEEENRRKAEQLLSEISEGSVRTGVVTTLKDYGAFVDLGGLEGLVHVTEVSHGHVHKASQALKVGQEVEVMILKIEDPKDEKKKGQPEQKKISLSIKALQEDPWGRARDEIKEGTRVKGRVARLTKFGAFVELLPGVDGLIHISNMSLDRKVSNPGDVVKIGEEVEARVMSIDWGKQRIGLSLVKSPQELANELKQGKVMEGKVDRIEDFGVFVRLPNGARGLVPARETGTGPGTDLKKSFNHGDPVKVLVQDVDKKNGRIRMSMRAAREAEERAEYAGFISKDPSDGKGLGTLGDLLKGRLGNLRDTIEK
jgi:small subunit ribosomal protein S1